MPRIQHNTFVCRVQYFGGHISFQQHGVKKMQLQSHIFYPPSSSISFHNFWEWLSMVDPSCFAHRPTAWNVVENMMLRQWHWACSVEELRVSHSTTVGPIQLTWVSWRYCRVVRRIPTIPTDKRSWVKYFAMEPLTYTCREWEHSIAHLIHYSHVQWRNKTKMSNSN